MASRTSQSHSTSSFASSSRSSLPSTASHLSNGTVGGATAPSALTRQTSAMSTDVPVATSSVVNRVASTSAGLYQSCLTARAMMKRVPGFEDGPWVKVALGSDASDPRAAVTPNSAGANQLDPVSQLLEILRLGSSLCYLFNAIHFKAISPPDITALPRLPQGKTWDNIKKLDVNWQPDRENLYQCKKSAAHFIMACGQELGWGTPQDGAAGNEPTFVVTMLYDQNTNATVKVVANVLRLLKLLDALGVLEPPSADDDSALNNATGEKLDDRGKVVREILDSERKYVQDLEVLQNYQRALMDSGVLPTEQIRSLFINLDGLVDFQRRFLIGVEANARLPGDEQRFGHLFGSMEEHFSCYEPFCANFASASQFVQDEIATLMTLKDILEPNYELPMFLIKPVQRICKYPLLLQQLVKFTPRTAPFYDELCSGLKSITRVTDGVNETTRQRENELSVAELTERVEDWKGHEVRTFGQLVLEGTFAVIKNDSEREYHVYLFERIILCCKEVGTKPDKKASKSNSILKKPAPAKKKTTLQLKGRIFINNVLSAVQRVPGDPWLLQVTWKGDLTEESFSIKCQNEAQLKKWQAAITKAVEEHLERKRRNQAHLSSSSRTRSVNSPLSQFPATPQSEMGPPPSNSSSHHHYQHVSHPSITHPYARPFDDEDDGVYPPDYEPSTGRGNAAAAAARRPGGHRSMPAAERQDSFQGRARANTEDQTSATVDRWRNQMPGSMPPVPRNGSMQSEVSFAAASTSQATSLRSSSSSRNLRHKPSHEWGSAGFSRMEDSDPRTTPIARQASQTSLPMSQHQQGAPPLLRNRSQSSPNIYQVEGGAVGGVPTTASMSQQWGAPAMPPLTIDPRQQGYVGSGGGSSGNVIGHRKRASDSSTDRSSDDSAGARTGTAASSPASVGVAGNLPSGRAAAAAVAKPPSASGKPVGSTGAGGAPAVLGNSSVRFKVKSGEDAYVIVALPTISYLELSEKVAHKLRNCGVRKDGEVKMRYEDEEGDRILISADDDVGMAIDWMRQNGSPYLTLYVD